MITKFKIYERMDQDGNFIFDRTVTKMLCINNHIGDLEDKYDFTVGKVYDIKGYAPFYMSFIDDKGITQYFSSSEVFMNFSTDQSWEDYLIKKDANKYNI